MAMEGGLSASDVALINDRNNCNGGMWGENGFFWIFALLMLPAMFNGGGWFGGNRNGQPVTEAGLCNAMNFNNLENAVGRLSDNQAAIARQTDNAICNLGYETLRNFNALQAQLSECCCAIQRGIDGVNFNISQSTAAINANTSDKVQKVLDWLCAEKAAAQAQRINQLELNQALCGVVRYPMSYAYNAGPSPFCGYNNNCGCSNGCGCGNI